MAVRKKALRVLSRSRPVKVVKSRLHSRLFRSFADKLGFVYFGYVDQRDDEHRLIRGLTLSNTHRDDNYCLGTYHGYDIAICERTDILRTHGMAREDKKWLIMTADLRKKSNVPHVFIGLVSYSAGFYRNMMTKFAYLQKMQPGHIAQYDSQFQQIYSMYTKPTNAVRAEQLFGGELNTMLVQHFPDFSFEVWDTTVYIYSDTKRPTTALLSQMLQCVAWLANEIDEK